MKNKKTIILIIVVLIAVICFGWWFVARNSSQTNQNTETVSQANSFFPLETIKQVVNQVGNLGQQVTETAQDLITPEETPSSPFTKISERPVADYGFITVNGTSTLFFIDQETGNFYLYRDGEASRLTNQTIPRIRGVVVAGNKIILKTIDENGGLIFYQTQITSTSSAELSLKELESNIIDIVASPDQKKFFKMIKLDSGVIGYTTDLNFKNPIKVFQSPLSEWVVDWPQVNSLVIYSKPSSGIAGSSFLIDLKSGITKSLISEQPGLTVKAFSFDKVFYTTSQNNQTSSFVSSKGVTNNTNLRTVSDKCVWGKTGVYITCAVSDKLIGVIPDDWYQGNIVLNDSFWDINPANGEVYSLVEDLDKQSPSIDALNLKVVENSIYFINKLDGSLWVLNP